VVSTTEANMIKLDQDGNVDKFKDLLCVRGNLHKEKYPTMKGLHSPAASIIMSKLPMKDAVSHQARIFQLGVIGASL
jgi:hypothetical protein